MGKKVLLAGIMVLLISGVAEAAVSGDGQKLIGVGAESYKRIETGFYLAMSSKKEAGYKSQESKSARRLSKKATKCIKKLFKKTDKMWQKEPSLSISEKAIGGPISNMLIEYVIYGALKERIQQSGKQLKELSLADPVLQAGAEALGDQTELTIQKNQAGDDKVPACQMLEKMSRHKKLTEQIVERAEAEALGRTIEDYEAYKESYRQNQATAETAIQQLEKQGASKKELKPLTALSNPDQK